MVTLGGILLVGTFYDEGPSNISSSISISLM